MNMNMQEMKLKDLFQEFPHEYILLKNSINDLDLKNLYSKLDFKYLNYQNEDEEMKKYLLDFLQKYKFITYQISPYDEKKEEKSSSSTNDIIFNMIICFEKTCLFVDSIKKNIFQEVFQKVKAVIVDIKTNFVDSEISSIMTFYQKQIRENPFLKLTIKPILMYMIRRFFYPSVFFEDPTFFIFNTKSEKNYNFSEINCEEMIEKVNTDKQEIINDINHNQINNFSEEEFIELRLIYWNDNSNYYLVFHIKSFHIFVKKKVKNSLDNFCQHEIYFCENYKHRCFTKFYGFIKKNQKVDSFIYEFMPNGTLQNYIINNDINEYFTKMTLIRIIEGIYYLHSHSLIYRDLKPSNILINHDFIPYLSDFETIRKKNPDEKELTQGFGSCIYSSPEMCNGFYSYPADIYSLGIVIYFIYERKHMFSNESYDYISTKIKNNDLPKSNNIPLKILDIYNKCIQFQPEKRPTIKEIQDFIFNDLKTFYFLELSFIKNLIDIYQNIMTKQYFKEIYLLLFVYYDDIDIKQHKTQLFQLLNFIDQKEISNILFLVGKFYYYNEKNYLKSKEYFEISAELDNSDALTNLGKIYHFGNGAEKNYHLAIKFYKKAAKKNHSDALNNLAVIHIGGLGVKRDVNKAIKYFERSAKLNNTFALDNLGKIFTTGIYGPKNFQKGFQYYILAANLNSSVALLNLGVLYLRGNGVNQDYNQALEYFKKSADLNNSDALYNIACMYSKGTGVNKDYKKVVEYLKLAAEKENLNAYNFLGKLYYDGIEVEQDFHTAKHYCKLASKKNDPEIFHNLGNIYCEGKGTKRNYEKARKYYELAANQNYSEAFNSLGLIYDKGKGVQIDYKKAKYYYEKAAYLNNSNALVNLGILYYQGKGVNKDCYKAKQFFESSIQINHNPLGYENLGCLYFNNNGIGPDYQKARILFEKAANLNNSNSLINLGTIYLNGLDVKKDINKAKEYFEIASASNNPHSFYLLGSFYQFGLGVDQNYEKAKEYYELALRNYSSNSINSLSELYLNGVGVQKDFDRAKKLIDIGIKIENDRSFYNLAQIYKKGKGLVKDYLLAKYYYELSAKQGNSDAIYKLGKIHYLGLGIKKDFDVALNYFEMSGKKNNNKSLYYLGLIYMNGQGVEQNYFKAKEYFELSASLNNSYAFFQLGLLYYFGFGVKKDYLMAKNFFELSSKKNNINADFYLSKLYEKDIIIPYNIKNTIHYLNHCASNKEIKYVLQLNKTKFEEKKIYNNYYYAANNDLGLIYLINKEVRNIKLADKFLKEAGLNEYQYGQNNFALFNLFYSKNLENAKYLLGKASKKNFVISCFMLGQIFEVERKINDSINYYIKASDCENEKFIFRNQIINDERLEISKSFVSCYSNLKISHYFYPKDKLKSNKFFLNAIFRPLFNLLFNSKFNSYSFNLQNKLKIDKFSIQNLSELILNNPIFHFPVQDELNDQNISLNEWEIKKYDSQISIELKLNDKYKEIRERKYAVKNNNKNVKINENEFNQSFKKEILNVFNYMNKENTFEIINENHYEENDKEIITIKTKGNNIIRKLIYPKTLSELILSNYDDTVNEILDEMTKILYKPPYEILFGRINIYNKNHNKSDNKMLKQNINDSFYEGFNA